MSGQLTESHYLMLANIKKLPLDCSHPTLDDANIMGIVETLHGCKYVFTIQGAWKGVLKYKITETGRKALAAYQAQRDLVLFIAEFEEKLERMFEDSHITPKLTKYQIGYHDALVQALGEYRRCKERIANVE